MSLRAVRSPLAPKMTMEQGSTAFRSASNRQAMSSSRCSGVFTGATLAEAGENFNVHIVVPGRTHFILPAPHVSRLTFHVSRLTFHVSRLTFHVSRLTLSRTAKHCLLHFGSTYILRAQ